MDSGTGGSKTTWVTGQRTDEVTTGRCRVSPGGLVNCVLTHHTLQGHRCVVLLWSTGPLEVPAPGPTPGPSWQLDPNALPTGHLSHSQSLS